MKKMGLCLALFALLLSLSGCAGVESALHEAGEKIQSNRVETPQNNGGADRVIVTISYELNGKNGDYGFDYEKDENGEYVLKRYGGGVSSDDL